MPHRCIRAVMNTAPFVVEVDAPLRAARTVMVENRVYHVPVVRDGRPVGLLTERDLHLVRYFDLLGDTQLTAGDVCNQTPYAPDADTPLADVLDAMNERRLEAALVVENGVLVGIYTLHAACRELAKTCA